jgi:hypothetical protein
MQQDYLAAPEMWAAAEKWGANTMDMANCLLELRARVEALEGSFAVNVCKVVHCVRSINSSKSLHSYKIGEAEPIEDWGKGHTLVNPSVRSINSSKSLHSYKIGEAEPIEDWGKGHTLVNPKPPSLKEQALEALGPEPMPETGPTGDTILNVGAIERHRFLRRALEALDD